MIKVVHIITDDNGGAANAAIRTVDALQQSPIITASVIVLKKYKNNPNVREVRGSKSRYVLFMIMRKVYRMCERYLMKMAGRFEGAYFGFDYGKL